MNIPMCIFCVLVESWILSCKTNIFISKARVMFLFQIKDGALKKISTVLAGSFRSHLYQWRILPNRKVSPSDRSLISIIKDHISSTANIYLFNLWKDIWIMLLRDCSIVDYIKSADMISVIMEYHIVEFPW